MKVKIPKPLKAEHEELHGELFEATQAGGEVAKAAKAVARLLHPHFVKEEEYALPPLGLLKVLARRPPSVAMTEVLSMTDRLKKDLPHMLKEHQGIVAALKALTAAARKEKKDRYAHFADKLILHAKTEEDVLYPAAILIGEYLKCRGR